MGLQACNGVLLCALVLLQLVCACQCLNGAPWHHDTHHGDRKQAQPKRALLDTDTTVLRSFLVHIDSGSNATASERFLAAVKRSQARVTQLQLNLQRRLTAADLVSPVSPGSGEYLMQIALGTPPQQFIVIADTGSDLIWVQCSPCTSCFKQPDALFDPTASSTYTPAGCSDPFCQDLPGSTCVNDACNYEYAYGDKSTTTGVVAFETVTLAPSNVPNIAFGCGLDNKGTYATADDTDGLVGLGRGPLSFPSQISPGVANIFSYCLVQQLTSNSGTSPITFGSSAATANVQYTPLLTNAAIPTFYYVSVTGITVGGQAVSIPSYAFEISSSGSSGGVIFDSGTTITSWVTEAFDPIVAAFQQQISYREVSATPYGLTLCYDVSGVSGTTFPDLTVGLANDVQYEMPQANLWIAADSTGNTICLALSSSGSVSQGVSIIGNIQQQNVLIVYDGVNQQIGFQATQCSTL